MVFTTNPITLLLRRFVVDACPHLRSSLQEDLELLMLRWCDSDLGETEVLLERGLFLV